MALCPLPEGEEGTHRASDGEVRGYRLAVKRWPPRQGQPARLASPAMIIRFILRALVAALGLWIASRYIHGIHVSDTTTLLEAALLLGIVNAFIRPIVLLLTLPFTLITLGLFLLVVNAAMLELVAMFLHRFKVDSFLAAILGSIVVSVVSWIGSFFIDSATRRRA